MDKSSEGLTPERLCQPRLVQHGSDSLCQKPVCTFCDSILLRSSPNGVLALYASLGSELEHRIAHILAPLVISKSFDASLGLVLSKGFEALESIENIGFCAQGDDKTISGVVIDECDPISKPREGPVGHIV
jgi:hypothetical protein